MTVTWDVSQTRSTRQRPWRRCSSSAGTVETASAGLRRVDTPSNRKGTHLTVIVEQSALLVEPEGQAAEFQGRDHGSAIAFIMVSTDKKGAGPALHQHPYDETFVIRRGEATFVVGDETVTGRAGQIIVVPPSDAIRQ